jgi:hypothetical protein
MLEDYKKTRLWQQLERRGRATERTRALLLPCLDEIQTILGKAIPLKDFTLHDQDHSFRVAQRMSDIMPPEVIEHLSPMSSRCCCYPHICTTLA